MDQVIDLNNYSPAKWLPLFKNCSLKTTVIKANLKFLKYLFEDGVVIDPKYKKSQDDNDSLSSLSGCEDQELSNHSSEQLEQKEWVFPEFDEQIKKALEEYNGVFPKLNWKAPRDCYEWVPELNCTSIEEIFTLFKSSTLIGDMLERLASAETLEKLDDSDEQYLESVGGLYIILKKWYDLNGSMEFRCFVRENKLVGICQRKTKHFYPFLKEKQQEIVARISEFFTSKLKNKFFDNSYVFDVYIDIPPKQRVLILDFNPWGELTNPIMFSFDDFSSEKSSGEPEFRYIQDQDSLIIEDLSVNRVPQEFTGELKSENLAQFIKMMEKSVN